MSWIIPVPVSIIGQPNRRLWSISRVVQGYRNTKKPQETDTIMARPIVMPCQSVGGGTVGLPDRTRSRQREQHPVEQALPCRVGWQLIPPVR